jgi:excisionase family DNA binding protein
MNELGAKQMTNYLSVRQLAAHFGLSIPTIRRWVDNGSLKFTRVGVSVRFSPENISQFLSESKAKSEAKIVAA